MNKPLSTCQIVHLLTRIQSTPYVNWMAMWGRQKQFDELHAELDRRGYSGPRPSRKLKRLRVEDIYAALYDIDPMETCCKENDCDDEYMLIAARALKQAQQGIAMEAALYQALCDSFGDDMVNGEHIEDVIAVLVGMLVGGELEAANSACTAD